MFDEDFGVQSYFGESGDCDFFGDTSMSGGFASGMGDAGFVSEAFAQDSMGGSFFTEASEFDTMGGEFFTESEADWDDNKHKPKSTPSKKTGNYSGWRARDNGDSAGPGVGYGQADTDEVSGLHSTRSMKKGRRSESSDPWESKAAREKRVKAAIQKDTESGPTIGDRREAAAAKREYARRFDQSKKAGRHMYHTEKKGNDKNTQYKKPEKKNEGSFFH